jgi:hypothetical protein
MRKAVRWTIYPRRKDQGGITIQSSAYICAFNPETREGMLSKRCSGGAYFLHLSPALGAKPIKVPQDVVDAVLAKAPGPGPIKIIG